MLIHVYVHMLSHIQATTFRLSSSFSIVLDRSISIFSFCAPPLQYERLSFVPDPIEDFSVIALVVVLVPLPL